MTAYVKIEAGIVVQKQLSEADGFIEAPDSVVCGMLFDGQEYSEPAPEIKPAPSAVSARQFKLQLLAAGIIDQVEAWIAVQNRAVRIAYDNSGSFVRNDHMMQAGFAAIGFTTAQIDAFFAAAAES